MLKNIIRYNENFFHYITVINTKKFYNFDKYKALLKIDIKHSMDI